MQLGCPQKRIAWSTKVCSAGRGGGDLTGEKGPISGRCTLHVGISHVAGNLYEPCACIRRSADGDGEGAPDLQMGVEKEQNQAQNGRCTASTGTNRNLATTEQEIRNAEH